MRLGHQSQVHECPMFVQRRSKQDVRLHRHTDVDSVFFGPWGSSVESANALPWGPFLFGNLLTLAETSRSDTIRCAIAIGCPATAEGHRCGCATRYHAKSGRTLGNALGYRAPFRQAAQERRR